MNSRTISFSAAILLIAGIIFFSILQFKLKRYSVNIAIESNQLDTLIIIWGAPKGVKAQFNQFFLNDNKQTIEEEVLLVNFSKKSNLVQFENKKTMHLNEVHCSIYDEKGKFSEVTKSSSNFYTKVEKIESKNIQYSAFEVLSIAPLTISTISLDDQAKQRLVNSLN